jgi:hypothetical protein
MDQQGPMGGMGGQMGGMGGPMGRMGGPMGGMGGPRPPMGGMGGGQLTGVGYEIAVAKSNHNAAQLAANSALLSGSVLANADPARTTATSQLNALSTEHLRVQERIFNTLKNLARENELLEERVEESNQALQDKHQRASEALQNKMRDDMKALQIEAENGARDIGFRIQDLNECTQERNQKYFDAQRKIIQEYQKQIENRK